MNIEIDKAKQELLDAIGNHHRNVVMLTVGLNLKKEQLEETEKSIVSSMRANVDRVVSAAYTDGRSKGRELGKQEGLAEARKLTKEEKRREREAAFNRGYCVAMETSVNPNLMTHKAFEQGKLAVTRMIQELFGVKVNCDAIPYREGEKRRFERQCRHPLWYCDAIPYREGAKPKNGGTCIGEFMTLRYRAEEPLKPFTGSYGMCADEDMVELEKERDQKRRFCWNSFPLFGAGKDARFRIGANGSESVVAFHAGVEVGGVLPSGTLCPTCWSGEARANKARIEAKRIAELDAKSNDSVVSRMGPPKMIPNPELFETVFNGKIVTLQNRLTRGVLIVADGWIIGSVCHSNGATVVRFVDSVDETVGAGCVAFLTGKILAFSSWQFRCPSANPVFKLSMCAVEGRPGYAVAVDALGDDFRLIGPGGQSVCSIGKSVSGLAFVPVIPHPPEYSVIDAALQTIRREFYGNMG